MTVSTRVINLILARTNQVTVDLHDGLRVQILPDITNLGGCQRHQNAAFIKDQSLLLVWADSPIEVVERATKIQSQMMFVFARGLDPYDEKKPEDSSTVTVTEKTSDGSELGDDGVAREDGLLEPPRKIVLNQAILTGFTLILIIAALGSGWRQIAIEVTIDHQYLRLAFIFVVPLQIWLALVCAIRFRFRKPRLIIGSSLCNQLLAPSLSSSVLLSR